MKKIGKIGIMPQAFSLIGIASLLISCIIGLSMGFSAHADDLTVTPSSTEVAENEHLSLEFTTTLENGNGDIGKPEYVAPDFYELNSYPSVQGVESTIINGHISTRRVQGMMVVLQPRKTGQLTIKDIQIKAGGRVLRAQDLTINVTPAGARSGQNSGSGYPAPSQVPGSGMHAPSQQQAASFFIKTEPNKLKAYKGEQILLTYALYTRIKLLNIQVERYPNISGFLKEDIDIPLLRARLDYSRSIVNGHEYLRAPLAQFAIYPLKEGTLPIDVLTGKFSYQTGLKADEDMDPFAVLNQFLTSMRVASDTRSSDRVEIQVLPLPATGQPPSFSGLVGDFDVSASADKTSLKVGEPLNVKVKIAGSGHAGSLERLNVNWPQDFELYEDKSNTQFLKTGGTERLFEYMLVPKIKGRFEIPSIEVSMFNPQTKSYQTRRTQPIPIEVLEGSLGNVYIAKGKSGATEQSKEDIRYWMENAQASTSAWPLFATRGLVGVSLISALFCFWSLGRSGKDSVHQDKLKQSARLKDKAHALARAGGESAAVFGQIESLLSEMLAIRYGIQTGSLTRSQIGSALQDQAKLDETTVKRIKKLLEICENERYAPGGGESSVARGAAEELSRLVDHLHQS